MKKKSPYSYAVQNHFRELSSLYMFILVLFVMGVICGSILVNSLSYTQKEDLLYYLTRFFGQIEQGNLAAASELLSNSIKHNVQYIGSIWLLGISIIGLPIILVLLFLKGVVIGFTVGFLVNSLGWEGFQIALGTILPQNLLLVPVTIFLTVSSLSLGMKVVRKVFFKNVRSPLKPYLIKYMISFIACIVIISGAAAIEAYISPMLMKQVISLNK